ncbi:hypothetical protein DPMN_033253 [Dreissena polymorpha]|uniref:Uncharacterized protein n=1 Tax=Dreissena polymorpha TaxID=45954 RepID=A0A9D4RJN7_DREPO|nr:hypothetical protein DPMN_033253 [Dreissena polymorpha]
MLISHAVFINKAPDQRCSRLLSETTTISSTASTLITTTPFIATTEFITPGDFKTVFFTDSFTTVGVEPTEEPLDPTEPGDEMTTFEPTTIEITEKPVTIYEEGIMFTKL